MTNEDIEEYAKYKMRTITGENGVSKYEMLTLEMYLWLLGKNEDYIKIEK